MGSTNRLTGNTQIMAAEGLPVNRADFFDSVTVPETPEALRQFASLIDHYIQDRFEASRIGPEMDFIDNPYAVVALGGYGRAEQCVHSDVDLLFVFYKRVPPSADALIREIVYPLWDIKVEVGYATRSIEECVRFAKDDYEILTSFLDARFICGNSSVFTRMKDQIRKRVILKDSKKIILWLVERNQERHKNFGDSTFLLQPNLKEGNGGLRDYHTLRWIAGVKYDLTQIRDLEYQGCLSHQEFNDLTSALSFIWAVRNNLHRITKRKCDQLYFEYQTQVADSMGFVSRNGQSAVEAFLSALHSHMTFIKHQLQLFLYELGQGQRKKWLKRFKKISETPGIYLERGQLNFDSPESILSNPEILIRIFEVSARLNMPLSREALRLVREFNYLVDEAFYQSNSVRTDFEKILLSPPGSFNVLEQMLDTGFLMHLIPEYRRVADRVQYDAYHLYPVDRHMLRTVNAVKTFGLSRATVHENLCDQIYRELKRKKNLLWAALLHDIGKGEPGEKHSHAGAKMAAQVMERMGYNQREVDLVSFLIENHLLLIKTATRRDTNDEETAISCARQINDATRLKMLYLLTAADSSATGPKAWNDWTATLLKDFFLKVLGILETGELASSGTVLQINKKRESIIELAGDLMKKTTVEEVVDAMSPRYFLYTDAEEILDHMKLFSRLNEAPFVWNVRHASQSNTRTVTICAKDRPGLFSRIAGVFTLNNINILDVQAYTWRNHVALDIFKVEPPPEQLFEEERWARAEKHLRAALSGEINLADELAKRGLPEKKIDAHISIRPNRVVIDNETSSFFTIIEVFAYDFRGLLYLISDAISRCGLNIRTAKIATKVDQVVDVFYVKDENDGKVDTTERVAEIQSAILSVLPEHH
ncbi:MAG: [protein-PII] uridylyltransferase [Desulfobacterales bacterium]|jgi:[protein-PII] uridylyltransferase|nr:[protein-PII] uridylyltransferase [Desulfobacterales bacterium]